MAPRRYNRPLHPRSIPVPSSRPPASPLPASFEHEELRILGVTHAGKIFRPADWAERLCRVMQEYASCVSATSEAGVPCVRVRKRLQQLAPMAYEFLLNFARDNELQISGLDEPPELSRPRAP